MISHADARNEALERKLLALTTHIRSEGGVFESAYSAPFEIAALAHALAELWHRNEAWKVVLDAGQRRWMQQWLESDGSWYNGSGRQRGKSLASLAIIDRHNREWARSKCRWMGLTFETASGIVKQAIDDYFVTCPTDLKPVWRSDDDGDLWWPNRSTLIVGGTDATSFRRARGFGRISIDKRDEFGFWQRVAETERALDGGLVVPGADGKTGRVLYGTTPAESPAHESDGIAAAHQAQGRLWLETIYNNPRADVEATLSGIMKKSGKTREQVLKSTAWRREYMGERIVEEKHAAVPRWSEMGAGLEKHPLVVEMEPPEFCDWYVALDPGKRRDPHALLLGWFDFPRQLLYFAYELELPSVTTTTREFAEQIKALEKLAFGANAWNGTLLGAKEWVERFKELPEFLTRAIAAEAPRQPYLRLGDDDDTMLKDLVADHGIAVLPTMKHDKHLTVDGYNDRIGLSRVMIHPRCRRLIQQHASTIWNEQRTEWVRTEVDHGDLLDCAVYIDRNVRRTRDPRPPPKRDEFKPPSPKKTGLDALKGLL